MKNIVLVCLFLLVATSFSLAQSESTATADANVTVVAPISIVKTVDLGFGSVVPSGTAGSVTISTANARTFSGGTTVIPSSSFSRAIFTVSGEEDATYSIALPTSILVSASEDDDMTVNGFTSNPNSTGILTGGSQTLYVGATVNVDASQPAGFYTGTFDVTVAYN